LLNAALLADTIDLQETRETITGQKRAGSEEEAQVLGL